MTAGRWDWAEIDAETMAILEAYAFQLDITLAEAATQLLGEALPGEPLDGDENVSGALH